MAADSGVAGTCEEGNPADAVEQGFPQASGSEELPSGSGSQTSAMMAVDRCSGHASPDDGTATVFLLVDQRERLRDVDPRGILNRASAAVQGPYQSVLQHRLLLGDFLWTTGLRACERSDWQVLNCVVERKRVSDLVGRSATGVHLRQMKRMELSGLRHPFLLIEGDQRQANSCPIFDEFESSVASSERGYTGSCAIHSLEDVEALCARLFITGSPIGVMATIDIEGTVRLLKQITGWFQWRLSSAEEENRSLISGQSLQYTPLQRARGAAHRQKHEQSTDGGQPVHLQASHTRFAGGAAAILVNPEAVAGFSASWPRAIFLVRHRGW
jgi:ERCC4-type nuclease